MEEPLLNSALTSLKVLAPLVNQTIHSLAEVVSLSPATIMWVLVILWIMAPLRAQWMRQLAIMTEGMTKCFPTGTSPT
ncbi:MARF [Eidolon helvum (bat) parvovirus 1]|uniref:MARF n=1 Tax=Eidolon helvum (bat) parvovirus 1 TaxID=2849734 RepID=H2ESE6_9VIRU|nr:MARF gene product [Eidolon helvum (bat) parvovirus]AEX38014.1 MARF [Eidolon helvum (bat) parvovirus 1]